jgi:hypothetical protein
MGQFPLIPKWRAVDRTDAAIVSELEQTDGVSSVFVCERELGVTVDKLTELETKISELVEGREYDTPVTDGWEYARSEPYALRHPSGTLWYGREFKV